MSFKCVDCARFLSCSTNTDAWEHAKNLYPVTELGGVDVNEQNRLKYIDTVAGRCAQRVEAKV
jgi:hypothetical protein